MFFYCSIRQLKLYYLKPFLQVSIKNMNTTAAVAVSAAAMSVKRDAESSSNSDCVNAKRLCVEKDLEAASLVTADVEKNQNFYNRVKCALLFMYSGEGYYGMQRNWEFPCIENEILDALLKKDLISQEEHSFPSKVYFQRASKTDKGVSALGNVVSIRIKFCKDMIDDINEVLPPQIRLLDVIRSTKKFDARFRADSRTYSYLLPTFAWASKSHACGEDFRLTAHQLARVRHVLNFFVGTRNFCHFTSGRAPDDKSCVRFINSFAADEPFVHEGLEFMKLTIHGQSFMLHQIRKMIGLAIGVVKGYCEESIFETVFVPCVNKIDRLDLPRAPGLGLMLEHVNYKFYNDKFCTDMNFKAIDWSRYSVQVEDFRRQYVLPHIVSSERNEGSMFQWLASLPRHNYMAERPQELPSNTTVELDDAVPLNEEHNSCSKLLVESRTLVVNVDNDVNDFNHCIVGETVTTDLWPAKVLFESETS